jgi:hypothetical protein
MGLFPAAERKTTAAKRTTETASAYQLRHAECGTQNITRNTIPVILPGLLKKEPDAALTKALFRLAGASLSSRARTADKTAADRRPRPLRRTLSSVRRARPARRYSSFLNTLPLHAREKNKRTAAQSLQHALCSQHVFIFPSMLSESISHPFGRAGTLPADR